MCLIRTSLTTRVGASLMIIMYTRNFHHIGISKVYSFVLGAPREFSRVTD